MCLRIQDASREVQGPYQEHGPWAGKVTHTTEVLCGMVSQDRWYKVKRLIQEPVDMEDKEEVGLGRAKMESIRGFLVHVTRTYRYTNPHLKGLHFDSR